MDEAYFFTRIAISIEGQLRGLNIDCPARFTWSQYCPRLSVFARVLISFYVVWLYRPPGGAPGGLARWWHLIGRTAPGAVPFGCGAARDLGAIRLSPSSCSAHLFFIISEILLRPAAVMCRLPRRRSCRRLPLPSVLWPSSAAIARSRRSHSARKSFRICSVFTFSSVIELIIGRRRNPCATCYEHTTRIPQLLDSLTCFHFLAASKQESLRFFIPTPR